MTVRRDFSGETDIPAMIALARLAPSDNLHITDLPYRLSSWALDRPDNVGLWADAEGQLLAWAVMHTPFWAIDYACHPRAEGNLHRQILSWADCRARGLLDTPYGRPMWFINVYPHQTGRMRDLEDAGFASQAAVGEDSWSKVLMERPAHLSLPDHVLPAGFSIRPLAGQDEVEAYVLLHRAVFESKNMTVEWRARTLRQADYRPDLDLVAAAPDGRLAAFCVCWLDAGARRGQVEPLGVDEAYRGLGLGRAILAEGLRRLYRSGAQTVYVETDLDRNVAMRLYEWMGFRPANDVLVYRKDYDGSQS